MKRWQTHFEVGKKKLSPVITYENIWNIIYYIILYKYILQN